MVHELVKALVEVDADLITVTFALGDPADRPVEWATYGADIYGPDGNGGKRFGVWLSDDKTSAHIFDFSSATQSNYDGSFVEVSGSSIVVRYRDASLGVPLGGTGRAYFAINGQDVNTNMPVTVIE
jgi:hypothetical protein